MAKVTPSTSFDFAVENGTVKGAQTDTGATKFEGFRVPLGAVTVIEGFNLRVTGTKAYEDGIEQLAQSILNNGYYQDKPISVKPIKLSDGTNGYALTDGHRRFAAAKRAVELGATLESIPAVNVAAAMSREDLTIAMMQTGSELSTYEFAIGVARLSKWGMDDTALAQRFGVSKTHIGNMLTLTSMPAKIRNMVANGEISATLAIEEYRADAKTAVERLTRAVSTAKASGKAKATEKHVEKAPPKVREGAATTGAEPERANRPGRKPNPLRFEFEFSKVQGDIVSIESAAPFMKLGGGAWYELSDIEGEIIIVQDVKIKGVAVLKEKLPGAVVSGPVADATSDL